MSLNAAASPLSLGIKVLRQVIKDNPSPNGWTKSELLKLALQVPPPPGFVPQRHTNQLEKLAHPPPHPEHPIRSLCFLKEAMRTLESMHEVKTIRTQREMAHNPSAKKQKGKQQQEASTGPVLVDVYAWKLMDPSEVPRRPSGALARLKKKPVVGTEVGVGLDTSHLSKRRQAARVGKVSRDVMKMKAIWAEEKEALASMSKQNTAAVSSEGRTI